MVDVGGDDGAAPGDLVAHELGRDEGRQRGAERLAVGQRGLGARHCRLASEVLARGDVDHLLRDEARAGILVLRGALAGVRTQGRRVGGARRHQLVGACMAVVLRAHGAAMVGLEPALGEPGIAWARQSGGQVGHETILRVGARGIVDPHRRLLGGGMQRDLAERHGDLGMAGRRRVDLARAGERAGRHALGHERGLVDGFGVRLVVHRASSKIRGRHRNWRRAGARWCRSLRWHYPGSGSKGMISAAARQRGSTPVARRGR